MTATVRSIKGTLLLKDDPPSIDKAAFLLKAGKLVAFPTETVYGLGASAFNARAVKGIFKAKGRPDDNPLIVHLQSLNQLFEVATNIPDEALVLCEKFWPGPLSLILNKKSIIPEQVSAGLSTVAVRMPDHRVALDFIKAAGVPVAAPSANLSGNPSPTSYKHVLEDLAGRIDAVIKSENCLIGVESTVLDLSGSSPVILRPGGVTREDLEIVLGRRVLVADSIKKQKKALSPGMKYRHYSPKAPLLLVSGPAEKRRRLIKTLVHHFQRRSLHVGLLDTYMQNKYGVDASLEELAAELYNSLREFDRRKMDVIIAEEIGQSGIGLAVMNRLNKAASRVLRLL